MTSHATVLHLMGIDHDRFSYRYLGLDQKLTGVEKANVVKELVGVRTTRLNKSVEGIRDHDKAPGEVDGG